MLIGNQAMITEENRYSEINLSRAPTPCSGTNSHLGGSLHFRALCISLGVLSPCLGLGSGRGWRGGLTPLMSTSVRLVTFRESLDLLCPAERSQRAAFCFPGIGDLVGSDIDYAAVYALLWIYRGTALWLGIRRAPVHAISMPLDAPADSYASI
jgi:hypothetical protein